MCEFMLMNFHFVFIQSPTQERKNRCNLYNNNKNSVHVFSYLKLNRIYYETRLLVTAYAKKKI